MGRPILPTFGRSTAKLRPLARLVLKAALETRRLIPEHSASPGREPDRSLLRLPGQAQRYRKLVMSGDVTTVAHVADQVGVTTSHFSRIFRLSFLAPQTTKAILDGRQPPELTASKLLQAGSQATAWSAQRQQLGFE